MTSMTSFMSLLSHSQSNNSLLKPNVPQIKQEIVEEELKLDEEEEEFAIADTFSDYMPSKCTLF
jgi:hypothetical protein